MSSGISRTGRLAWQLPAAFVLAAVVTGAPAIAVLAIGAIGLWLVVAITGRLALAGIEAKVTLAPDRIVTGEAMTATLEIANRKPVPLTWLDARLFLGEGVEPAAAAVSACSSGCRCMSSRAARTASGHSASAPATGWASRSRNGPSRYARRSSRIRRRSPFAIVRCRRSVRSPRPRHAAASCPIRCGSAGCVRTAAATRARRSTGRPRRGSASSRRSSMNRRRAWTRSSS